jgi:hypothetical protein
VDGLRVVPRHTFAKVVHIAEIALRDGISLIRQRTQKSHRRRVITMLKRRPAILKLPRRRNAEQREHDNAAGRDSRNRKAREGEASELVHPKGFRS